MSTDPASLRAAARDLEKEGSMGEALVQAWAAFDADPSDPDTRTMLAHLLQHVRTNDTRGRTEALHMLIADPGIDPRSVALVCWQHLTDEVRFFDDVSESTLADKIEDSEFVRELLKAFYVPSLVAEKHLTALRRWLLMSDAWAAYPQTVAAMAETTRLNQGAWLFDADERARLSALHDSPIAQTYQPRTNAFRASSGFDADVTNAVAGQYEGWPYPVWTRINRNPANRRGSRFPSGEPLTLPDGARILAAGCGTGREAALAATTYPNAQVTAIDISDASLAYARERCATLGITNIDFRKHDLNRVADLGMTFDFIVTSGVLHHLPSPEAGWAALRDVLKPGAPLRIMVYSKVARLNVAAGRAFIGDLARQPVNDDMLRAVRAHLIGLGRMSFLRSFDFFTLGGVKDLYLHEHEDPFDIRRIQRTVDALDMEFLGFGFPDTAAQRRYMDMAPHDTAFRDFDSWSKYERAYPFTYAGMYRFWCARRG
ncbi:MAG: methyltransferase domain-containing protein [Alphaproteobacteria bacterium]|nr:methyltransferase domain-containing protein [Alphaproteobacteria bacterium]